MIASYIDQVIMVLVGVWASMVGFGLILPPTQNPAWIAKYKTLFRVIGPLLVVIGVALAVERFARFNQ